MSIASSACLGAARPLMTAQLWGLSHRLASGYGQFTEGKASPHAGRSHVHWLTGTASTVMVGCVEGILGMRPDLGELWGLSHRLASGAL